MILFLYIIKENENYLIFYWIKWVEIWSKLTVDGAVDDDDAADDDDDEDEDDEVDLDLL